MSSWLSEHNPLHFLFDYFIFFFALYLFAFFLDVCGVFDKSVSYYAGRSFRNLSEIIHRCRFKRDYAIQLAKDRYDRLLFTEKLKRCFQQEEILETDLDINRIEEEWQKWKLHRKLSPEDIVTTNPLSSCSVCQKEKFSEYYFTELLNLSYLGTRAYRRSDRSDKLSIFGLFNLHFAKGFMSDFIFYVMNNHSFLSMFMAVRGHPYSRNARRLTYLSANCITFFFSILLIRANLSPASMTVLSIFVVSPVAIIVRKWVYALLTCPCHRPILEREERGGLYYCYSCLGFSGTIVAYLCVIGFMAVLYPAAMATPSADSGEGASLVVNYAHSVTLTSFGQEFIYAFLVFWTGEASVTIKLCRTPVLGYGGYFHDKVHVLGLRGLRLQQMKLTYMQEKLERRQEMERAQKSIESSKQDEIDLESDICKEDAPPAFRRSVTVRDVPPSVLHQYDYAIQEIEWLRYITNSVVEVEFFVSVPFVREFYHELKDEYADMTDEYENEPEELNVVEMSVLEEDSITEKALASTVQKWNSLFEKNKNQQKKTANRQADISWDQDAATRELIVDENISSPIHCMKD